MYVSVRVLATMQNNCESTRKSHLGSGPSFGKRDSENDIVIDLRTVLSRKGEKVEVAKHIFIFSYHSTTAAKIPLSLNTSSNVNF
jgi:hypothetical protein